MATSTTNDNETSEWSWTSWISSAKEKSLAALNATTRDLAEFVNVVQGDTTSAVSGAAVKVKQIINQDEVVDNNKRKDDTNSKDLTDGPTVHNDNPSYDRSITHLEILRADTNTYCTIPEGKSIEFLEWSKDFDLSIQQEEISRLLVVSNNIRKLHSTLVPAKVSYESFWFNYFYRMHLINQTEANRAEIMARVHSQGQLICWDDDDDIGEHTDEVTMTTKDKTDERAMTDSSESFICVNEEKIDNEEEEPVIDNKEDESVINTQSDELLNNNNSDSDGDEWEKWN